MTPALFALGSEEDLSILEPFSEDERYIDNFGRASVPSVTVISCILVCGKEVQPL